MKKSLFFITAAAAVLAILFSCTKEEKVPEQNSESTLEENVVPGNVTPGDGVFTLTLTAPQTRTEFGTGSGSPKAYPKNWTAGDVINVNGVNSQPLPAGDYNATATFTFTSDISAAAYQVVYPASAYSAGKVTIPAAQTYSMGQFDPAADIILGYGTAPDAITLNNAVAYLKVRLTKGSYGNFGVKNIKVASFGKKLCGEFAIADGGLSLTVPDSSADEAEQTVTLSTGGQLLGNDAIEFLIAVAPQACDIAVTFADMKDNTQVKNKAGAVLAKGGILALNAFGFDEYHAISTPADLLAFADSCSAGNSNYWVITANIDMDGQTWPAAGTSDDDLTVDPCAFRGTLDGGNHGTENGGYKISNLTSTTGAFLNYLAKKAVVKNLTLDSTCSISYTADITANTSIGAIIGMSRGAVSYCYNRASVSCSSANYSGGVWLGGIVGRQYRTGSIDHCYNYAAISCAPVTGNKQAFVGGILGSLERIKSGDNATISNCENSGAVTGNPHENSVLHLGGVIGRIDHYQGSLSITGLVNTGNVTRTNANKKNGVAVVVGGLIGGIHGDGLDNAVTSTTIKGSHVSNCTVSNGTFNNWDDSSNGAGANFATATHVGGFIGFVRGSGSNGNQVVVISDNCYVSDVDVAARRGYMGGFIGWAKGVKVDDCDVLNSAAQASLANAYYGGGLIACGEDVNISNCDVTLKKNSNHSLYTNGTLLYTGGIAGWLKGTSVVDNCRAFVRNMYQGTDAPTYRGWIIGYNTGTLTIKDCWLGGTYGNGTPTITLNDGNFSDYIYGSASTPVPTLEGTQHYWDGTL